MSKGWVNESNTIYNLQSKSVIYLSTQHHAIIEEQAVGLAFLGKKGLSIVLGHRFIQQGQSTKAWGVGL